MSQPITYNNDDTTSRRFTGFPLNSTLVSSYTPDTIRSIITHAAAGQPYSTAVWIRVSRVGIQVSAQDAQIARTRIPVFIPIGLINDIFMLPSINNVICIVYEEIQSNMKGILLYVVHPSDAQNIREDFRIVKQAHSAQQPTTYDNRYSNTNDIYLSPNTQLRSPISTNSSLFKNQIIRPPSASSRPPVYTRDNENYVKRNITPILPQINYIPSKDSYHSDHRRHRSPRRNRSGQSSSKRSTDSGIKQERKHTSRSPDKRVQSQQADNRSTPDLSQEKIQEQQQQQQQQIAAWQAAQQAPLIPIGIYNRYVPKTIPLPTGETLKTTLALPGAGGATMNGTAMAYIEQIEPSKIQQPSLLNSRSRSISSPVQQQNRSSIHQHHHHHKRHHTSQPSQIRSKEISSTNDTDTGVDEETKQYLKLLVDEMQAMKMEMNKLRQTAAGVTKGRSDSLQVDLKDIRSHIDLIRSRMAMTPRIIEQKK